MVMTRWARSPLWKKTKVFPLTMTGYLTQIDRENEVKGEQKEYFLAEGDVVVVENDLDKAVAEVGDHDQTDEHVQVLAELQVNPVVLLRDVEGVVDEDEGLPGVGHEADHHHDHHQHLFPERLEVSVAATAVPDDLMRRLRR